MCRTRILSSQVRLDSFKSKVSAPALTSATFACKLEHSTTFCSIHALCYQLKDYGEGRRTCLHAKYPSRATSRQKREAMREVLRRTVEASAKNQVPCFSWCSTCGSGGVVVAVLAVVSVFVVGSSSRRRRSSSSSSSSSGSGISGSGSGSSSSSSSSSGSSSSSSSSSGVG